MNIRTNRIIKLLAGGAIAAGLVGGTGVGAASASHLVAADSYCSPTPTPSAGIANDFAYEHQNSVQAVTLSNASCSWVRVDYTTVQYTAQAGTDYVAESGTLWFKPGDTVRHVVVDLIDDNQYESNEYFGVRLSNPVGATLSDSWGWVTISGLEPAG